MKRRKLIKMVTLATGGALTIPLSSSLLTACQKAKPVKESDYVLEFFNQEDFEFLKTLLDVIIPKTDSPSAIDVGVHQTIDSMVGTVYSPDEREHFSQMFEVLNQLLKDDKQFETIDNLLESSGDEDSMARTAFLELKQQAVAYYLSTEEIGKNYLTYLPVPGEYQACISLEAAGGKAWAL